MQAEGFPEPALDAVAVHCSADCPRDGEAQPRSFREPCWGPLETERGEQRAGDAEAVFIDVPELGPAQDP